MGTKTVYQEAMRTKVRCPNCQKTMQARYLAYQHYCKRPRAEGELRQIGLRRLAALQERAVQRLTPETQPSLATSSVDDDEGRTRGENMSTTTTPPSTGARVWLPTSARAVRPAAWTFGPLEPKAHAPEDCAMDTTSSANVVANTSEVPRSCLWGKAVKLKT